MIKLENENLAKYTTFKIGGDAELFIIPENEHELIYVYKDCINKGTPIYFLGGGSNLLISDKGIQGCVVHMIKCSLQLKNNNKRIRVGASVRLQSFIRFLVENNLFAFEYLYSVPGTLGGAIYMNAGRGKNYNMSISDYLIEVKFFDGEKIISLKKKDCCFGYRSSIFQQKKNYLILEAEFDLPQQDKEIGKEQIKKRIEFVKNIQDNCFPNVGSIFKKISPQAIKLVQGVRIGNACFSQKTDNWICNLGNAKMDDVKKLIKLAQIASMCFFYPSKLEIEFWGKS